MSDRTDLNLKTDVEPTISTSTSLLDRVKAQDSDAWGRLVKLYGPLVYGWCRTASLQGADASDVTQEVFLAVANNIMGFRRDRPGDSFRGWLWGITRNKIADHCRRLKNDAQPQGGTQAQQRLTELPNLPEVEPKNDEAIHALELRAIELIRAGFEDRTWNAFWRTAVDGQRAADVAEELGMNVKAVYQAKYRVQQRVRDEIRDAIDW